MLSLYKNLRSSRIIIIPVRYKHPVYHWSRLKKKKSGTQRALDHFNEFYASIYKKSWKIIRASMLEKEHRYVAIVNNYSDSENICKQLESLGSINMKRIYEVNKKLFDSKKTQEELKEKTNVDIEKLKDTSNFNLSEKKNEYLESSYEYSKDLSGIEKIETKNENDGFIPFELQSIQKNVTTVTMNDRIIAPGFGLPASQIHRFIPATKLMGKEDFIFESDYFHSYKEGLNFSVQILEEDSINFPDPLYIYTFESANNSLFPKPEIKSDELKDYFTLDSASILPVLSLDLHPEDKLLDMCAGPGGKTLIALQCLYVNLIVANDVEKSRLRRIKKFVHEFIPNSEDWHQQFILTLRDARNIDEKNLYNKILVDVPCTTDRHSLQEDDNNIFKGSRNKERLSLPLIQTEILVNALKLITCGGIVVYSTCTLSPIQNDGVVQMALKKVFEENNIEFIVKDQTKALAPLKYLYSFDDLRLKYGHLVVPTKHKNCGPMYFCKMERIK